MAATGAMSVAARVRHTDGLIRTVRGHRVDGSRAVQMDIQIMRTVVRRWRLLRRQCRAGDDRIGAARSMSE